MLLSEALTDAISTREAYNMFRHIVDDTDLLESIAEAINKHKHQDRFTRLTDIGYDVYTVIKRYLRPMPVIICFKAHKHSENGASGMCSYGGPNNLPLVTYYLTTNDDIFTDGNGDKLYNSFETLTADDVRQILMQHWDDVIVHELSHAFDQTSDLRDFDKRIAKDVKHTRAATNQMNKTLQKHPQLKKEEPFFRYANHNMEVNARVPQSAILMASAMLKLYSLTGEIPPFKKCIGYVLHHIGIPYKAMVKDTQRRVVKRMYDMYATIARILEAKGDEIQYVDDVMDLFYKYYNK